VKIILATIQTPFIHGGAEYLIRGLNDALSERGVYVERVSMPFRFAPLSEVSRSMEIWENEDLTLLNGYEADHIICLQFPTYYLKHPHKVLWLLHQYRMVYDLWDTPFATEFRKLPEAAVLRDSIRQKDAEFLSEIPKRFTIAKNVSSRLERYTGVSSTPIYHPPFMAEGFYNAPAESYVLVPSRLEEAKRQSMFIRAMKYVRSKVVGLVCGDGGQKPNLEALAAELGVDDRITFLGQVTDGEKLGLYAHCLCVFFGPYDEDYGYVTLEAMLSQKAVITCSDSGGPLEFVVPGHTGFVTAPDPEQIAETIDWLHDHPAIAVDAGKAGLQRYSDLNISWRAVVESLLG
jgi:glycosyltransferase involved in cell wall biosynthesis